MRGPFLLLALLCFPRLAQSTIFEDMASPVTTPAKYYLIGGSVLTAGLIALHKGVEEPFQRNTASNKPLSSTMQKIGYRGGQLIPNVLYAGGMLVAHLLGEERALARADMMASATVYSGAIEVLTKEIVHEVRPNLSDEKAFPSGHATVVFAFAGVIGAEHPWYFSVPAYSLASLTAYSRINDNAHWLHDVVAGATLGMVYGIGMHYRRPNSSNPQADIRSRWHFQILPTEDRGLGFFANTRF